jgi:uncharacterized Zn-finger protein
LFCFSFTKSQPFHFLDDYLYRSYQSFRQQRQHDRRSAAASANGDSVKPFKCDLCGKLYARPASLRRHKKYECVFCPNVIEFRCPLCPYIGRRKDYLQNHMAKHYKEGRLVPAATALLAGNSTDTLLGGN